MYKNITVKKEVTEVKDVITGERIICDQCNKEIYNSENGQDSYFFEVTKGHNDWGNDSVDSIENLEICSDECLYKALDEFLKENRNSHTAYFEITKTRKNKKFWNNTTTESPSVEEPVTPVVEDPGPEKEDTVVIGAD